MKPSPLNNAPRRDPAAVLRPALLVLALLSIAACTVSNTRAKNPSSAILFSPRPLAVIQNATDYYPDASKRVPETGEVILHFRIGADGAAEEPFSVDEATSAPIRLIEAARMLFRGSRYETGEHYRHDVTASVLFDIMPCGQLHQAPGLDYYYHLCIPPPHIAPTIFPHL